MALNDAPDLAALDSSRGQELVIEVLRAAARHEAESHGPARRAAFRTTRYLIEGATLAGLPAPAIAEALGVKPGTLRTRRGVDGLIEPALFAELAGIAEEDIERWRRSAQIELIGPDPSGMIGYRASELLAARIRDALLTGPVRTAAESIAAAALYKPARDEPPTTRYIGPANTAPQRTAAP